MITWWILLSGHTMRRSGIIRLLFTKICVQEQIWNDLCWSKSSIKSNQILLWFTIICDINWQIEYFFVLFLFCRWLWRTWQVGLGLFWNLIMDTRFVYYGALICRYYFWAIFMEYLHIVEHIYLIRAAIVWKIICNWQDLLIQLLLIKLL